MTPTFSAHDDFVIEHLAPSALSPNPNNARRHSQKQITRLKAVICTFGFTNPILIDERSEIIAGHGRLEAAIGLKLRTVPCIRLSCLNETQKSALALADNSRKGSLLAHLQELAVRRFAWRQTSEAAWRCGQSAANSSPGDNSLFRGNLQGIAPQPYLDGLAVRP